MTFDEKDIKGLEREIKLLVDQYTKDEIIELMLDALDAQGMYDLVVALYGIDNVDSEEVQKHIREDTMYLLLK